MGSVTLPIWETVVRCEEMNATFKIILGWILLVISIIVIKLIISGWNDCKNDTENIFINFVLFVGDTWDLWAILFLTTAFGLMLVTKNI